MVSPLTFESLPRTPPAHSQKINRRPAGTIKMQFRKLNSVLCEPPAEGPQNSAPVGISKRIDLINVCIDQSMPSTGYGARSRFLLALMNSCEASAIRGRSEAGRLAKRGGERACLAEAHLQSDIRHR